MRLSELTNQVSNSVEAGYQPELVFSMFTEVKLIAELMVMRLISDERFYFKYGRIWGLR